MCQCKKSSSFNTISFTAKNYDSRRAYKLITTLGDISEKKQVFVTSKFLKKTSQIISFW
jgi:hypothetical protein